jgi:C4-dicarboxylate-specific signal transduction histidine kinase
METNLIITLILIALSATGFILKLQNELKKAKTHNLELQNQMHDQKQDLLGKAHFSELGLMMAGITHELNNLMTIIQARVTQLLRQYNNPEKEKEVALGLNQIAYTVERMNKTVSGIREFVHVSDTDHDEIISIDQILNDVSLFCGQRMKNHGMELRVNCPEGLEVKGHKVQLKQAFINLVNNSFDAIDKLHDKWVEVKVVEGKENLEIYFKDSGFGISHAVTDRMMDPYYTTKASQGTGLGLSYVKAVAEQHGGSLTYLDKVFNTTFLLTLPKVLKEEEAILPNYFDQPPSDIYPLS